MMYKVNYWVEDSWYCYLTSSIEDARGMVDRIKREYTKDNPSISYAEIEDATDQGDRYLLGDYRASHITGFPIWYVNSRDNDNDFYDCASEAGFSLDDLMREYDLSMEEVDCWDIHDGENYFLGTAEEYFTRRYVL